MPLLMNEDQALKARLQGVTVRDMKGALRPVNVRFRFPEQELRDEHYPFIAIEPVDISRAADREHRGVFVPPPWWTPEGWTPTAAGYTTTVEEPIPYDLTYMVTSYARYAMHDREITAQLMERLPARAGYVLVDADKSIRRLDVLSMQPSPGRDHNGKRVFRTVWALSIPTEVVPPQPAAVQNVTSVALTLKHQTKPFVTEEL